MEPYFGTTSSTVLEILLRTVTRDKEIPDLFTKSFCGKASDDSLLSWKTSQLVNSTKSIGILDRLEPFTREPVLGHRQINY